MDSFMQNTEKKSISGK